MTARVHAESVTQCYEVPELVNIPKTLGEYSPEIFSPNGNELSYEVKVIIRTKNSHSQWRI